MSRWGDFDGTIDIHQFAITDPASSAGLRFGCASFACRNGRPDIHARSHRPQHSFPGAKTHGISSVESGRRETNGSVAHAADRSAHNHQQRPAVPGRTYSSQRKDRQPESRPVTQLISLLSAFELIFFRSIFSQKSRLIATVRFPPHAAIVDVQRIRDAMISNEFDLNGSGVSIVRLMWNWFMF